MGGVLAAAELCFDLSELDHGLDKGIEEGKVDVWVDDEVGEVDAVGIADGLEAVGTEGPAQRGVAVCGGELGVEAVLSGVLVASGCAARLRGRFRDLWVGSCGVFMEIG